MLTTRHIIFKLHKTKDNENIKKETKGLSCPHQEVDSPLRGCDGLRRQDKATEKRASLTNRDIVRLKTF